MFIWLFDKSFIQFVVRNMFLWRYFEKLDLAITKKGAPSILASPVECVHLAA